MLGVVSWIFFSLFSRICSAVKGSVPRDRNQCDDWRSSGMTCLSLGLSHLSGYGQSVLPEANIGHPAGCSWPSVFLREVVSRVTKRRSGFSLTCCLRNTNLCSLGSYKNLPGCKIPREGRESRGEHSVPLHWTCSSLHKKILKIHWAIRGRSKVSIIFSLVVRAPTWSGVSVFLQTLFVNSCQDTLPVPERSIPTAELKTLLHLLSFLSEVLLVFGVFFLSCTSLAQTELMNSSMWFAPSPARAEPSVTLAGCRPTEEGEVPGTGTGWLLNIWSSCRLKVGTSWVRWF